MITLLVYHTLCTLSWKYTYELLFIKQQSLQRAGPPHRPVRQFFFPSAKPISLWPGNLPQNPEAWQLTEWMDARRSGNCELVIETANDTHYYSGLTYPLVLGTSQTVTTALTIKLIFYALFCFFPAGSRHHLHGCLGMEKG